MHIICLTPLAPGVYNDHKSDTITAPPAGWAMIPEGFQLPATFPFLGSVEAEELTYTREAQVEREVTKTREAETLREVTKTREVETVDEEGNPITTTEKYVDYEPVTVTEEYTELEVVTEQQEYTMMTVTAMTEGTLPEPDLSAIEAEVRAERDRRLAETDWTQVLDAPITQACREAFRAYRQALRNIPEQAGFPTNVEWPAMPEVVKAEPDPVDTAVDVLLGGEEA